MFVPVGALSAQVMVVAAEGKHAPDVQHQARDAHHEHEAGGAGHVVGCRAVLLWVWGGGVGGWV